MIIFRRFGDLTNLRNVGQQHIMSSSRHNDLCFFVMCNCDYFDGHRDYFDGHPVNVLLCLQCLAFYDVSNVVAGRS